MVELVNELVLLRSEIPTHELGETLHLMGLDIPDVCDSECIDIPQLSRIDGEALLSGQVVLSL
jgi:hypothetical protein